MKCDESQSLQVPYLDSELDARTTIEIEQHLKSCTKCARLFAMQERLDARVKSCLNQGQRTAALWEQIERSVAAAASATVRRPPSPRPALIELWRAFVTTLGDQLQAGWRRSPGAWAGLTAVWVVILTLNFAARESETRLAAGKQLPHATEVRFAVKQKRLLLAELAFLPQPILTGKSKAPTISPRSERRAQTLNI
ncbi:MAG TPA: zf-HC2 domain-containing protein [Candidatus Paceibacterota bacterium]|nr:zf-HC2 domain-containing protein [Verrucomicrobiota bacterium]HSA11320.1 zf-HC2 domain-containing protein [Candidatus Paceibacterota bacterium]